MTKTLLLDCGSGGRASQRLINELFLEQFDNPILRTLDDAAKLELSGPIAMSTAGYTVTPLFFPGGNIGTLAVHGTVNDVSMLGARPRYLTCGFILEEGLDLDLLRKVVESMAEAARSAGVLIVSGDTKVGPRGACDKLFITTAGVGEILADPSPSGSGARPGDAILVSGAVGDHGLAVLGQRDSLSFLQGVESDSAALNKMVERLMLEVGAARSHARRAGDHAERDRRAIRGGLFHRGGRDPDPRCGAFRLRRARPRSPVPRQ